MSATITLATARRVLVQLLHDRRTVVLIVALPAIELTLLRFVLDADPAVFDRWAVPLLGVFPLITMFLVTSVAMLRERTSGTLERLLTTPIHKLDLLVGYGLAFALAATAQAVITCGIAYGLLGLETTRLGVAGRRHRRRQRPAWAWPSACSPAPSPAANSKQPSSCRRWSSPSCCCAA